MNEPYGFEETFGFNSIRSEIDDEILKNRKTDAQQSEDITTEGEERAAADEEIDSRLDALEEQSEATSQLKEDFDAFTGTTYANDKAALEEKDSALEAKDTELEQSISDEAARAEAKEQELEEAITNEENRAVAAEEALEAALENEKTQREENDTRIDANVSALRDEVNAKFTELDSKDAEIEDALDVINGDGDGSIKKAVADGIAEVVANAPEDLDTLKEIADYIASDKTKAAEIETKLSDHDSAIDALEAKDEELVAKDADLEAAINEEAQRATAAEVELQGKDVELQAAIDAEADRAAAKEAEIEEALNVEAQRATAAESELEGKITAEQARAEAKETELETAINTKTDKEMSGTNGKALIFNESDGGGAKFEHTDGTWSFAGVNDGGENGIAGQIYAVKKNASNKMEGTRIDVTKGAMYYTVGDASAADRLVADNEIAVKGDVAAVDAKVEAIDLTPYAKSEDVNAELANKANASDLSALNDAVGQLSSKVGEKAAQSDLEVFEASSTEALNAEVARAEAKEAELVAKDAELEAEINDEVTRATAAESELQGKITAEQARAEAKENELAEEIDKKVEWTESTAGRNHIVLKNHDSILGTATDGSTYNVAMVSKWDVADFGSAQLHANLNSKDGNVTINDDKVIATKDEVEAVDAKVNAIDLTPYAKTEDVNAELANKANVSDLEAANAAIVAESERAIAKEAELVAKDEAQDVVINGKVDRNMNGANGKALIFNESDGGGAKFEHNDGTWSFAGVNDGGENGIAGQLYVVKKNASNKMEGTRIDMTKGAMYYTVGDASAAERMVADNEIAVKGDVKAVNDKVDALEIPSIEGLAKSADVTAEIAAAVSVLNTKDEAQDAEIALKANSDNVYTKEDVNNTLEGYVPLEQYNDLKARLDNLEIMMSVYNAEREAQMDEIISNMSSDNKEVVTETLMESIVVPETTVAYTITAPLTDNSTVELTSPKYMTLINTSKEPVSTTISHTYEEGETTTATAVYLVGDFNTLTLENVSPNVKSGYDAATVKDVVITENNVKNLSLYLDFQDGATITNNSDKDITIYDRSNSEVALTIVAPNSTVTLNNGQFTTLNAEVSDNTLIIKKNVHIDNLNLTKGNAIVEVARAEEAASIVENYTVADGYSVSHRIYHITNENSSKLGGVGEMILDEDITRTSSVVAPLAPAYDAVWNLNGHNITVEGEPKSGVYLNRYASNLEVKGEGVIRAEGTYGLWNNGTTGKIIINDGVTIEAQTHAVYAEKGIIEINGGTFKLTNWADADKDENGNLRFLINCYDSNYRNGSANIIVRGGKFYDFDPANCAAEGVGTSFVADGYVSVMTTEMIDGVEHKVYTVQEA